MNYTKEAYSEAQLAPPEWVDTRNIFQAKYAGKGVGFYSAEDWRRLLIAYNQVEGADVLDVGAGNGAFLNILARSNRFASVTGVDIRKHSMLLLPESVPLHIMSVTQLRLPDKHFDTVVCMEVLEHLEHDDLPLALIELRRVCRGRLVCTVPYNEQFPLFKENEVGGHRQSFDDAKLDRLFPGARRSIIPRAGVPWVMIVDDNFISL
jgi:SAM-dependent methyltransferase